MKNPPSALLALALLLAVFPARGIRAADAAPNAHPEFEVAVSGQGRPVVFIPGLATPGDIWQPTVDQLKATCQCHVITLAGFGDVRPTGADPFLPRVRDEIIAYLRDCKLVRPVIVGHSLGGTMALWIAATAPDVAGRLVIVDAMPFMGAMANPAATVESARAQFAPMAAKVSGSSLADFAAFQQIMMPQWVSLPEEARRIAAETGKSDPKTAGRAMIELMSTDLRGELKKITCPVLVLGALADKTLYTPKDDVIKLFHKQYAALHGVRFEMFENAKHFLMVDDPAGFQKALESELAAK